MFMSSPSDTLLDFMREMHDWEIKCYLRSERSLSEGTPYEQIVATGMSEYMDIFGRHCSSKRGVPRDFYYDHPPDYDPTGEEITAKHESLDFAEVYTRQQYGYRKQHLYRLCREDKWRIYEKTIILDTGEILVVDL